jgi:hypothetical protein
MVNFTFRNYINVLGYFILLIGIVSCSQSPSHPEYSKSEVASASEHSSGSQVNINKKLPTTLIVTYRKGTSTKVIDYLASSLPNHSKKALNSNRIFLYKFTSIKNTETAKDILSSSKNVESISNDRVSNIDRNFGYR